MCVRMVDSLTTSAVAISRFQSPRATSSRTCRSRGASASRPADRRGRVGCWAMRSITRRVTEGESRDSPAAIVCTAAISSSGRVRLTTKPEAQASAPKTSSCSRLSGSAPARGARRAPARASPRSRRRPACGRPSARRPARAAGLARRPPDRLMPHRRSRSPGRRRGAPRTRPHEIVVVGDQHPRHVSGAP